LVTGYGNDEILIGKYGQFMVHGR